MDEIDGQIEREREEIENAPRVPVSTGRMSRCHWCGQPSRNLYLVETVNGQERYKGDCCGQRHSGVEK